MEFKEALKLVIGLADLAVLGDAECDSKELFDEQNRQQEAIALVQEYEEGLPEE
jgi:hypothetical protein